MSGLVDRYRDEVAALCRKHSVRRLKLFGSATTGFFDAARSDLDFLVELDDLAPEQYAEAYFSLQQALQELFGRHVDLITESSLNNPHFRRRVLAECQSVYAR